MGKDLSKGEVITKIRELISTLKRGYNAEAHVVLYTSMGQIVCDIEPPTTADSLFGYTDDPTEFTVDISAFLESESLFESQLINAKNAIFYSHSGEERTRMNQVILFADQIIGFSIKKGAILP